MGNKVNSELETREEGEDPAPISPLCCGSLENTTFEAEAEVTTEVQIVDEEKGITTATKPSVMPIDNKEVIIYPEVVKDESNKRESRRSRLSGRRSSSVKISSSNPFAPRKGKDLTWNRVTMAVPNNAKTKKGERRSTQTEKRILDNVWGKVPKEEITAIMGPSGAGKTSLLNILAGRQQSRGKVKVLSEVRMDNKILDPTKIEIRKKIAFVAQEDSLTPTCTPREAIYFSAKLRLPASTKHKHISKLTKVMLRELGLEECADTLIGGGLVKGISGGQKKRTSVGVELVVKPSLVCLDEPTSGLDSFSAVQLFNLLHKVAKSGASVLFTIHQPPSEIFNMLDHLILLNKGRVMFEGEIAEIPEFFSKCNSPVPPNYNPADWIMQVAQLNTVEELESKGFFKQVSYNDSTSRRSLLASSESRRNMTDENEDKVDFGTEVSMLVTRELNALKRDKAILGARLGITLIMSLLAGTIFFEVGEAPSDTMQNLQSHNGSLLMVLINAMFGTAQPTLIAFPINRPIFLREYSTNHYSVSAYFLCQFTMEAFMTAVQIFLQCVVTYFLIKFQMDFYLYYLVNFSLAMTSTAFAVLLGCAVEDPKTGFELMPLLFVPQILFAGFFVVSDLIPVWLRWSQSICSLTYSVRLALWYEFKDCDEIGCLNILDTNKVEEDKIFVYWLVLLGLLVVCRLGGLKLLQVKATKFY